MEATTSQCESSFLQIDLAIVRPHGCTIGPLGALYPLQTIPLFDAARSSCKVEAIQHAFYDAQGELALPCNLATVFLIGAYMKVDFKLGARERTDGQKPPTQTLTCAKSTALIMDGFSTSYRRFVRGLQSSNCASE